MTSIEFFSASNEPKSQSFFTTFSQSGLPLSHSLESIIRDATPSTVAITRQDHHILKLIKPRSWHEYFKMFWGHSRYHKEIQGNYLLRKIGLQVPEIYETGIGSPATQYEYLGFYIMENLQKRGFDTLLSRLESGSLTPEKRNQLFGDMLAGLQRMKHHRIVFTDFHLENVMVNDNDELVWIDTGVTRYHWYSKPLFRKKLKRSIKRLLSYHGGDFFNAQEQQALLTFVEKP